MSQKIVNLLHVSFIFACMYHSYIIYYLYLCIDKKQIKCFTN